MSCLSKTNVDELKTITVVHVGSLIAFKNPDDTWVSIQPDGSEQSRLASDSPGAYELAIPQPGNIAMFTTDGTASYLRKYYE